MATRDAEFVFYDLETTGKDPMDARIVEIYMVRKDRQGNVIGEIDTLVNPKVKIPTEASEIHHITDDMVVDAPSMLAIANEIVALIDGAYLVGYNNQMYDNVVLFKELDRVHTPYSYLGTVDVCNIYKQLQPRTLSAAYREYTKKDLEDAHEAKADVDATIEIFEAMMKRHPDINEMSQAELSSYSCYGRKPLDDGGWFEERDEVIYFIRGKHAGKPAHTEPGYLEWMTKKAPHDFLESTLKIARRWVQ